MLVAILVAVAVAFVVGMGYVLSRGEALWPLAGHLVVWGTGVAIVLWFFGAGWDAVIYAVVVAGGVILFLLPAAAFNARRNHRERREVDGLR